MDDRRLQRSWHDLNPRPCAFEKAIQRGCCGCPLARRILLAEHSGVGCSDDEAQGRCLELYELFRRNARFALRLTDPHQPLPPAKRLQTECGGLQGLQTVLGLETATGRADDVDGLAAMALERFGAFGRLPFQEIVPAIAAFEPRPRRR